MQLSLSLLKSRSFIDIKLDSKLTICYFAGCCGYVDVIPTRQFAASHWSQTVSCHTGSLWPMPQAQPAGRSGLSTSERASKLSSTDLACPLVVKVVMSELNKEVVDLVWGRPSSGGVSASIFRRWTQGMMLCHSMMI